MRPTISRVRLAFSIAVLVATQVGGAWAAGELNVARPGGAFSRAETATAEACERACTDDNLCMAWSYSGGACELKATVPAAIAETGAISGLSHRAPASVRMRASAQPLSIRSREPDEPVLVHTEGDDLSAALLGGPEAESAFTEQAEN